MKVKLLFLYEVAFMLLSTLFFIACEKEEEKSYPYVIEYQELSFGPTLWHVLTSSATNQIGQPPTMVGFDDTLKTLLLSEFSTPPFRRLEFLSDSAVVVTFIDGNLSFDTIMPYFIYQNRTTIILGPSPEESIVFYPGLEPNSLTLGVISTMYSFKQPNGIVDYSPVEIGYSEELNVFTIIENLRDNNNLTTNDTVAVNKAGYKFE